jgi:oligosaccharide repeat unit polymerase
MSSGIDWEPVRKSGRRRWAILTDVPQIKVFTGLVIALIMAAGLIKAATYSGQSPLVFPLAAALISAIVIIFIDLRQSYGTTYMRLGFHAGMMVFLIAVPIISPELMGTVDDNLRFTAGVTLVLCIVGFELAYWYLRSLTGVPRPSEPFVLLPRNYAWATRLLFLGLLCYGSFLAYAVASSGQSLYNVIFVLRGQLAINVDDALIVPDDTTNKFAFLLSYGRYMAAAAATVLLLAHNPYRFPINKLICWASLIMCAFVGLNSGSGGSRGVFMLSSVPLLTAVWLYAGTNRVLRQLRPVLAAALAFFVFFGFQYLTVFRLQGEEVEARFDEVSLTNTEIVAAFSIYKDYENIVGGFPEKAEFQNGESIIPLLVGWIPRRFWPEKPYPFTSVANQIMGYKLTEVTIASSLPGEGYGNFGVAGGFLGGALMGLACAFADYRLSNIRPGHPLALGMRGMMAVWAALLVRGGTAEMFYMGLFPIAFMWVCLYFSQPRFATAST